MPANKLKTIRQLAQLRAALGAKGKKVALCHGVFDLVHPGHIKHLEAARRQADALFVTVTPDRHVNKGPGRPVFSQQLRAQSLAALEPVSYVAVNEWPTAVETIAAIKPDFYFKGSEYADHGRDITGGIAKEEAAARSCGAEIRYTGEITFSSTELLNKFFGVFSPEEEAFLNGFRRKYSAQDAIAMIQGARGMKALVVGDAIIDEYHYCRGLGKPPKDNIISAKFIREERFAGGALACANHLAGICGRVDLLTCLGARDSCEDFARAKLARNVRPVFFRRENGRTTIKRRFVDEAFLSKLFEIEIIDDTPLPPKTDDAIARHLSKIIGGYDLVLVSDFGHGLISPQLLKILERAKFLALNAQTNSANAGYNLVTKYRRADYICVDEPEIRLAARDRYGDLKNIVKSISRGMKCRRVCITRGHNGALARDAKTGFAEVPAFAKNIVDRVGAGDSFLAFTAPLAASGAPADMLAFIGSAAAAIKVGIVCNREPVNPVSLCKFINTLLK
ncbi:MAG: PfkB family carbohydrate kinase [Elusimicrobiales bacterium]